MVKILAIAYLEVGGIVALKSHVKLPHMERVCGVVVH